MYRLSFFMSCLLWAMSLHAQDQILEVWSGEGLAIIQDADGYTNVREAADPKSKVIAQITDEEIFTIVSKSGNWIQVAFSKKGKEGTGFMHHSRVKLLTELEKLSYVRINDSTAQYSNGCVAVTIESAKFELAGREIGYMEEIYPVKIDGKRIWGTDGNLPRRQIHRVMIQGALAQLQLPEAAFRNTFEPNFRSAKIYVGENGLLVIHMSNSDGAGSYDVIWVVKNLKYVNCYFGDLV